MVLLPLGGLIFLARYAKIAQRTIYDMHLNWTPYMDIVIFTVIFYFLCTDIVTFEGFFFYFHSIQVPTIQMYNFIGLPFPTIFAFLGYSRLFSSIFSLKRKLSNCLNKQNIFTRGLSLLISDKTFFFCSKRCSKFPVEKRQENANL